MPDPILPGAERDVLACIHKHGETTAREIRETMEKYRPMAHGSVVTLLKRLEAKGLVTKEKAPVGKAFVYTAAQRPEKSFRRLVKEVLQRVFHGDGVALVASLFDTQPPTPDEVKKLQEMLDDARKRSSKGGRK